MLTPEKNEYLKNKYNNYYIFDKAISGEERWFINFKIDLNDKKDVLILNFTYRNLNIGIIRNYLNSSVYKLLNRDPKNINWLAKIKTQYRNEEEILDNILLNINFIKQNLDDIIILKNYNYTCLNELIENFIIKQNITCYNTISNLISNIDICPKYRINTKQKLEVSKLLNHYNKQTIFNNIILPEVSSLRYTIYLKDNMLIKIIPNNDFDYFYLEVIYPKVDKKETYQINENTKKVIDGLIIRKIKKDMMNIFNQKGK